MKFNFRKLNNPLYAVQSALTGLKLLGRPGIREFVWIPITINVLLYSLAFWLATYYFSAFIEQMIPAWLEWLNWLLWPLFGASFLLGTFFTFTLLGNLIASPFYGKLAERAEKVLTDQPWDPATEESLLKGVVGGLVSELKRMGYFLLRAIPLLLLFLIPGVNLIAPVLWMVFSAWFLALEYFSYPLEGYGQLFPEQRQTMKNARLGATSLGGIVMLGLTVPLLNILVPPAAVVGATAFLVKGRESNQAASD